MLSTVSELVGLISARSGMNRRFETVNHHHGGTCAEHFKQGKQKKKKGSPTGEINLFIHPLRAGAMKTRMMNTLYVLIFADMIDLFIAFQWFS